MIYNIKAVCRDGGAVERARFEIVLCRNVYKGSNPFLCATKIGIPLGMPIFVRHSREERDLRVEALKSLNKRTDYKYALLTFDK